MYKIVPFDVYARVMEVSEKRTLAEQIETLPKATGKKVQRLLDILQTEGATWDKFGISTGESEAFGEGQAILPLVLFAVRSKERPSNFGTFASFLGSLKIPRDLLSSKAMLEVKKAKRNAKT